MVFSGGAGVPLPPAWLNYAALDVEVLLEMRESIAAVLAEQNDEWADAGRRYISLEAIAKTLTPAGSEVAWEVPMIAA